MFKVWEKGASIVLVLLLILATLFMWHMIQDEKEHLQMLQTATRNYVDDAKQENRIKKLEARIKALEDRAPAPVPLPAPPAAN